MATRSSFGLALTMPPPSSACDHHREHETRASRRSALHRIGCLHAHRQQRHPVRPDSARSARDRQRPGRCTYASRPPLRERRAGQRPHSGPPSHQCSDRIKRHRDREHIPAGPSACRSSTAAHRRGQRHQRQPYRPAGGPPVDAAATGTRQRRRPRGPSRFIPRT
jgi:hypothetical protein